MFHTQLCHTPLCHTPSFTLTTLSHTIFHLQLCHLSHTTWSPWRFAWQAWHLRHWAGSGGTLGRRLGTAGRQWRRGTLRGRRGTWWHPPSSRVAGVALGHIHLRFVWQAWRLWHWAGSGGALGRRLGAAGRWWSPVTPRHFAWHLNFAWQVWHFTTSTFVLCGRRGTSGTGLAPVAHLAPLGRRWSLVLSFCVAGVALGDIHLHFAWQTWHFTTSTCVSLCRRGTWRGIWLHRLSFCVACLAMFDGNFGQTFWHVYRDAWCEPCFAMCYCKPCLVYVLQLLPCLTFWHVWPRLWARHSGIFTEPCVAAWPCVIASHVRAMFCSTSHSGMSYFYFFGMLTETLCKIMCFWSGRFALTWKEATGAEIETMSVAWTVIVSHTSFAHTTLHIQLY